MLTQDIFLSLSAGGDHATPIATRTFRILRKGGHMLLAVPAKPQTYADALALYPPQTAKARFAKRLFAGLLHSPLSGLLPTRSVTLYRTALTDFVTAQAGGLFPEFALIAGNPDEPGRRFAMALLDHDGSCQKVVKWGCDPTARELIEQETKLLREISAIFPSVPHVADSMAGSNYTAFATQFYEERTTPATLAERVKLAHQWIWPTTDSLSSLMPSRPHEPINAATRDMRVHPVVFHGDFTPWNMRLDGDELAIIDWEKAQRKGPPLWDLLHYEVQDAILVQRVGADATLARLDRFLAAPEITAYLAKCEASGLETILVEGYLRHADRNYPPIRGRNTLDRLISLWRERRDKEIIAASKTPQTRPDFTIVTPSCNQLDLLRLNINSVCDQTGEESRVTVEHIVRDAKSRGIERFAAEVGAEFEADASACHSKQQDRANYLSVPHALSIHSEPDQGMYDAIGRGFRMAAGNIVAWLNSDEQYLPGILVKVKAWFDEHPEVDVLFGDALVADNKGDIISYRRSVIPDRLHTQLAQLGTFSCATFVRRRVIEMGILPDPTLKAFADAKWIVELRRRKIRMAVLPEPLAVFMLTTSNLGQSSMAYLEMLRWRRQLGIAADLLRWPVIALYRIRKLFAGAYRRRDVRTSLYRPASPAKRTETFVSGVSHKWALLAQQTETMLPEKGTGTAWSRVAAGILLPLLISLTLHWIDHLVAGVVLAPFLSIVFLLGMAFFLPPPTIALAAVVFCAGALVSFAGFANVLPQETRSTGVIAIRFASFIAASIGALMLSVYRQRANRTRVLNTAILTHMTVPLVVSDAMGLITFANTKALVTLKASQERIVGEKWTKLFMADRDEGTATRFYVSFFGHRQEMETNQVLHLAVTPDKETPASLVCLGEGSERVLLTTLA